MITEKDIIKYTLTYGELSECKRLANELIQARESAGVKAGGVSRVRGSDRDEMVRVDAIVGQIGGYVGCKFLFGNPSMHLLARHMANERPTEGDNGIDIPGTNIDFKTSLIRTKLPVIKHHLPVRPHERHKNRIYIRLLVEKDVETSVYFCGWATEEMLPSKVKEDGPLSGAYVLDIKDLNTPMPIKWNF